MTSFDSVAMLSEQELLDHFTALVVRDRRTTAELLVAIAEIDERKLWAAHSCSSMFSFCMERFHMSEQVTAKRLWAARTARRFPVILHMVERGELHLGAIHLLAKHLTAENHVQVLERAKHKSSREVEQLAAELAPQADVASRIRAMPGPRGAAAQVDSPATAKDERPEARDQADSASNPPVPRTTESGSVTKPIVRTSESGSATKPIVPLSPQRYKIEITVDEATHDKLRSLQDLLARSATGRDPAAIISRAIDVLHLRTLARKAGWTDRPKPAKTACTDRQGSGTRAADTADSERTRTIPAAVRREVWRRDCGRCCYVDARGRRCGETRNVEFHHRDAFAMGGRHTPQNIELRCAAHNQYQADLDFGRSFMDGKRMNGGRGKTASAQHSAGNVDCTTFPGECRETATA